MNKNQTPPLTHLGIIVDGNRRWAKEHNLSSLQGHSTGLNRIEEIVREVFNCGIQYVSLFVFSTENWNRSKQEVDHLMKLFLQYFKKDGRRLIKEGVCFKIAGRIDEKLSQAVVKAAHKLETDSQHNEGQSTIVLCFNYGGQVELVDMVKSIVSKGIQLADISLDIIKQHLYQPNIPNLDLVIRTSGEKRLSGFQLFRAAYAELLFVDKYWPDFGAADLRKALDDYSHRNRRFGK